MIQEYYLHLFCGTSGEYDQHTGAGRLAIATLMSGFGLTASNKKDLQGRVNWRVTPGCFLGQKELQPTDYYCRNFEEVIFAISLVPFRKVNRTMNYQLDWTILNGEWDFRVTSPIWINLSKIYWLGYFMFGRNVIPEFALAILRERFSAEVNNNNDQKRQLNCHHIMQFMKNIGLPLNRIQGEHIFRESQDDLSRRDIFASLALGMNWIENSAGFYTAGALIPSVVPQGAIMRDLRENFAPFLRSRPGRFHEQYFPLTQAYYYTFGLGTPSLPNSPSRMPNDGKNILPLLFCDRTVSPQQEARNSYAQVRGEGINLDLIGGNIYTWYNAAMLWEYHLLLNGEPLFPLELLTTIRNEKGWSPEYIVENLIYLNPVNTKNSSVPQIARFNLDRQLQV